MVMEKVIHFKFLLKLIVGNITARVSWMYSSQPICVIFNLNDPNETRDLDIYYIADLWVRELWDCAISHWGLEVWLKQKDELNWRFQQRRLSQEFLTPRPTLVTKLWPDTSLGFHWSPPQLTYSSQKIRGPRSVSQSQPLTSTSFT